ncbi:MAG: hypothetical protein DI622_14580 [Chryseobacterium sp.]|nr:MAG: hypothetical protein DI622_14580 [Chryseobacterium sp.]
MNQIGIAVYNGKEYRKQIAFNRPFFPPYSSLFILKQGTISFERQLQFIKISEPVIAFIDHTVVYEFSEISDDTEAYIVSISKEFYENISLKFNTIKVFHFFKKQRGKHFFINQNQLDEFFTFAHLLETIIKNADLHQNINKLIEINFSGLVQLLISFIDKIDTFVHKTSRQEQIVLTFLQNVELYLKEEKKVDFYAKKQSITVRYLSQTLKQTIGKTGLEIITEFQLKEAMALLVDTEKNIKEIADVLKFSDSQTFSHFFKRLTGITPNQYRNHFSK